MFALKKDGVIVTEIIDSNTKDIKKKKSNKVIKGIIKTKNSRSRAVAVYKKINDYDEGRTCDSTRS